MKYLSLSVLVLFSILIFSCTDDLEIPTEELLYFNSFENGSDLIDIHGFSFHLSEENTGQYGDSSLIVSGGCIGPHLYFDLGPFDHDKKLTMNFIAKGEYPDCGSVVLSNINTSTSIYLSVQETYWTYHETIDTLLLGANDTLRLHINSGGIASCNSWFDLLTVVEHE